MLAIRYLCQSANAPGGELVALHGQQSVRRRSFVMARRRVLPLESAKAEGDVMTRFFFDFRKGAEQVADTEGTELADVEEAYLEAFKAAQEMWSDLLRQRFDPRRCYFDVRNHDGEMMFVLPFQEVVDSCKNRPNLSIERTFEELAITHNYAMRISDEFRQEIQSTRRALQESRALLQRTTAPPPRR
jgi:hypothetical protein